MIKDIADKIIQLIKRREDPDHQSALLRKSCSPLEIREAIDIAISDKGTDLITLNSLIDKVIDYSVNTDHALFMNQMYGKQHSVAVLGDILTTLLNTSMYTYEVAPVMTVIEKECINRLCSFVWNTKEVNDGVFTPGGSISNIMAMILARNSKFPESKINGLFNAPRFSIFISEQAHYSFIKGAMVLGFGDSSIVKVATDSEGKIKISSLCEAIVKEKNEGRIPLMIVGVAGTTFSGNFDNLESLAEIAKKENLWFHVDAAYGGSLLFSENEKYKLKGIELSDSVTWNLHKMIGIPLICSVLLTQKTGDLNDSFSVTADYLFHEDNDWDLGRKSLQCGRRVDALKLWLAWKYEGDNGFEKRIDCLMKISRLFADEIRKYDTIELLQIPESPIICFRFWHNELPLGLLNSVNKRIREKIFHNGHILFNYSTYNNIVYLRCVISDPNINRNLINSILKEVIAAGDILLEECRHKL